MQLNISGHQLDITDALRDYVTEKMSRLERHFDKITNVQVTPGGGKTSTEGRSLPCILQVAKWSHWQNTLTCTPPLTC